MRAVRFGKVMTLICIGVCKPMYMCYYLLVVVDVILS